MLSVLTWNVLAPCYNKLGHSSALESSRSDLFTKRFNHIVSAIKESNADVVCLQEFWFNKSFQQFFRTELNAYGYSLHQLRRTGSKQDGVCVLTKNTCEMLKVIEIPFNDEVDRVLLICALQSRDTKEKFLVATTHLTFPHHEFDEMLRLKQVHRCIGEIKYMMNEYSNCSQIPPTIFAGDFNCNKGTEDDIYKALIAAGFKSCFHMVHGREVKVTHKNHAGSHVGVDFVWLYLPESPQHSPSDSPIQSPLSSPSRSPSQSPPQSPKKSPLQSPLLTSESKFPLILPSWKPKEAYLLPNQYPDSEWPLSFSLSDHRPLQVKFG